MTPKFKNRENKLHKINGKDVWESRSPAVVVVILAIWKDNIFVLGEKRSETMMDVPGKWVVPCGYIDWDEHGWEAVRREVYEESGLDINKYKRYLVHDNDQQPFYVQTNPAENRQNIALTYCLIYDFSAIGLPQEPVNHKDSEVEKLEWIPIERIFNTKYDWAFNHDERIEMAVNKFEKYLV